MATHGTKIVLAIAALALLCAAVSAAPTPKRGPGHATRVLGWLRGKAGLLSSETTAAETSYYSKYEVRGLARCSGRPRPARRRPAAA